jgi:hypothetical protein
LCLKRSAPIRIVPVRSRPDISALLSIVSVRSMSVRSTSVRFVFESC